MSEPVQSVERAFRILETFDARHPSHSAAEIAELANLPRPTIYRLLHTLESLGYLRRRGTRYEPTARVLSLAAAHLGASSLATLAQSVIDTLADDLDEAVVVGVLDGDEVVTVAAATPPRGHYLSVAVEIGRRLPADSTALGQVLAATTGNRTVDTVPATGFDHVISDGLLEDGLRAMAVPVTGRDGGTIAAISVAVNAARVSATELRTRCLPRLLQAAQTISAQV